MKSLLISSLLCFSFMGIAQNFQWSNAGSYTTTSSCVDPEGNFYTCGYFSSFRDFNPDSNQVTTLSSAGSSDIFIQKFDANGTFKWAKSIGSTGQDEAHDIKADKLGNILITGGFSGTVDFDPGPNSNTKTALVSTPDKFLLKLDTAGNFVWVKSNTGFGNVTKRGNKIAIDASNNIYYSTLSSTSALIKYNPSGMLLWSITSSANIWSIAVNPFDEIVITGNFQNLVHIKSAANSSIFTLYSNGSRDMFIAKYSASGYPQWAHAIGGSGNENELTDVTFDHHGNIYFAGGARAQIDFDPGPNTFTLPHAGGSKDAFIAKYTSNFDFIWAKSFGGPSDDVINEIETDNLGSILVAGFFDGTADFDPSYRIANKTSNLYTDMFWARYDSLGDFQAVHTFSSSGSTTDRFISFFTDQNNNIFTICKATGAVDMSIDPNQPQVVGNTFGGVQSIAAKYSSDTCSYFTIYVNHFEDLTCNDSATISTYCKFGVAPYTYQWNTVPPTLDSILVIDTNGAYTLTATDARGCVKEKTILVNGPKRKASFDLNTHLVCTSLRAGFPGTLWCNPHNDGCTPVSGHYKLVLSSLINPTSIVPVPDSISGDTLMWHFTNLIYNQDSLFPEIQFTVDTFAQINDQVCFTSLITPFLNDADTINNQKEYCFTVQNSYDPNDKQVFPTGVCAPKYILNNEVVTYTVRFQNTGTADAVNIVIRDSLSALLDSSSIRIVSKSHDGLVTELLPNNVVHFKFSDINLPDSASNPISSNGFVTFEIQPKNGIPNETILTNNVNIYFDFNLPITTNTVSNTFTDTLPSTYTFIDSVQSCEPYFWNGLAYDSTNTYHAEYTSVYGCDSNYTLHLIINEKPDARVNQAGFSLVALGSSSQKYQWYDCTNAIVLSNDTAQVFNPLRDGNYAVIVSNNFCSDTSVCFTVNGIGLPENYSFNEFSIYPNPGSGTFNIQRSSGAAKPIKLEVYDAMGKMLYYKNENGSDFSIVIDGASGFYTLKIVDEEKQYHFRLVKM